MAITAVNINVTSVPVVQGGQSVLTPSHQELPIPGRTASDDSVATAKTGPAQTSFNNLQRGKSLVTHVANNLRATDRIMDQIGRQLEHMRDSLERIVKNFPPFPQGSEERLRLLKSFNSLRHQIDAMTIPQPPENLDGARKIIADPAVVPEAGDWKITLEQSTTMIISSQQVHTGTEGLDIQELPALPGQDASDEEIFAALDRLSVAGDTLADRKAGLAAQVTALDPGSFLPELQKINTNLPTPGAKPVYEQLSVAVQQEFSFQFSLTISGGNGAKVLQGMLG